MQVLWVWLASLLNEYFFYKQLMIILNDGYAFAEGARDLIAGFHLPHDLSYYFFLFTSYAADEHKGVDPARWIQLLYKLQP